jgi:hypothetical protein
MPSARKPTQLRIAGGTVVIAVGALMLLVSLFCDWYGSTNGADAISAWTAFEIVDVLLAALALTAIYAIVASLLGTDWPMPPWWMLPLAGPVALVLIVISIINPAPVLLFAAHPTREAGIWIALSGALLMSLGILLGRVRISLVLAGRERPSESESADPAAETRRMPSEPPTPGA